MGTAFLVFCTHLALRPAGALHHCGKELVPNLSPAPRYGKLVSVHSLKLALS